VVRLGVCLLASSLAIAGCGAEVPTDSEAPAVPVAPPPTPSVSPPAPPPTFTVAGDVTASGQPLAGARVCARREVPILDLVHEDIQATCVNTDATGAFEMMLGTGIYFVAGSAEHHLPRGERVAMRAGEPGVAVKLELVLGGREYVGRVVDLDKHSIAGARVAHVDHVHLMVEVETDEQGGYRLWSSRSGRIEVDASGYTRLAIPEREGQQFVLLPESSIAGTVVDRKRQPVANARVILRDYLGSMIEDRPENAARTDAHGRFRIGQLPPGHQPLTALSPDRETTAYSDFHVSLAEGLEQVVLTLDEDVHRHRALIVDAESGAPVPGCLAKFGFDEAWGDEHGHIDVSLPFEGTALDTLICPGYVTRLPFPPIGPEPVRIEVGRGVELHATVVAAGRPLAGYVVSPRWVEGSDSSGLVWLEDETTDALGRFVITGLAPGTYGFGDGHKVIVDDRPVQEAVIPIQSRGRIEVEVGAAHAGRPVVVNDCEQRESKGQWVASTRVEPNGLAVVEWVSPGRYRVILSDLETDRCGVESVPITVAANETARVQLADAQARPRPIRVRVVDPTGEPAAGAVVSVDGPDVPLEQRHWFLTTWTDMVAITDAEGRAELPRYVSERFVILAARPGQFGARRVKNFRFTGREIVIRLWQFD
jgi:hypothetical protein